MILKGSLAFVIVVAGPLLAATPRLILAPVTAEQLRLVVSASSATGAASDLAYEAACSPTVPGLGSVTLRWRLDPGAGGEQRVDVSKFPEGFDSGRYEVSAPLDARLATGDLERMEPGVNYFWRVLRRSGPGWVASETGRFEAPTCPVDRVIETEAR